MAPFLSLTSIAAPLLRDNIDTDIIIPSREIRQVSKHGLADGLFAPWRYLDAQARTPDPGFILNQAPYAGAHLLLAGNNFGCGSSREHAVWALIGFGIRAILAPGFAPIFADNCANNGLLAGRLPLDALQSLAGIVSADPRAHPVTVDLHHGLVVAPGFGPLQFEIDAEVRTRLLEGLDAIDLTLREEPEIAAFRARDRQRRPWAYPGDAA